MKKLMMSLIALAMLSTVASAKTTEKTSPGNVNVKTAQYNLPKTNTMVKVSEEVMEKKGQLTRCRFVLKMYSQDDLSYVGSIVSETYTNGSCGSFFAACRAYWGV